MRTVRVVIIPEFNQLARQVRRVPEKYSIKIFAADSADQAFDERMRNRYVGHRLDLIDFKYAQVGEPAVKTKQRVVVGAEMFR